MHFKFQEIDSLFFLVLLPSAGNEGKKEPADAKQEISETMVSHPPELVHVEEQSGSSHVLCIYYSSQQTENMANLESLALEDEVLHFENNDTLFASWIRLVFCRV